MAVGINGLRTTQSSSTTDCGIKVITEKGHQPCIEINGKRYAVTALSTEGQQRSVQDLNRNQYELLANLLEAAVGENLRGMPNEDKSKLSRIDVEISADFSNATIQKTLKTAAGVGITGPIELIKFIFQVLIEKIKALCELIFGSFNKKVDSRGTSLAPVVQPFKAAVLTPPPLPPRPPKLAKPPKIDPPLNATTAVILPEAVFQNEFETKAFRDRYVALATRSRLPEEARKVAQNFSPSPLVTNYTPSKEDTATIYFREQSERHPALQRAGEVATAHVDSLEKLARKNKFLTPDQKQTLEYYKNIKLQTALYMDNYHMNWGNCNYFRDLCKDQGFMQAVSCYIPMLSNARSHALWMPKKYLSAVALERLKKRGIENLDKPEYEMGRFTRVGAFSAEVNGWSSLLGLKEIERLPKEEIQSRVLLQAAEILNVVKKKKHDILGAKKLIVKAFIKKQSSEGLEEIIEGFEKEIEMCVKAFIQTPPVEDLAKVKIRLNKLESATYALKQLLRISSTPNGLTAVIKERRRILQDKMLQLIEIQMKEHPECFKDGVFKMAHLGLINWEEVSLDDSGWMHDEGNAIKDMAAIFEEFNGKRIRVVAPTDSDHLSVPYLHYETGAIIVPSTLAPRLLGKELNLQAIYVNMSVQKHIENDGIQHAVNAKALQYLMDSGLKETPLYKKIEKFQEAGFDGTKSYQAASEMGVELMDSGFALSEGCSSCKDRGGIVAVLIMMHLSDLYVKSALSKKEVVTGITNIRRAQIKKEILEKWTILVRIIFENSGIIAVKTDPRLVPGLSNMGKLRVGKNFVDMKLANAPRTLEEERIEKLRADKRSSSIDFNS